MKLRIHPPFTDDCSRALHQKTGLTTVLTTSYASAGEPTIRVIGLLSGFADVSERRRNQQTGLWLRRTRVRAPSVTLLHTRRYAECALRGTRGCLPAAWQRRGSTRPAGIGQRPYEAEGERAEMLGGHSPVGVPLSPQRSASWWRSHRSRTSCSVAPRS
jgi:hypothetical protein